MRKLFIALFLCTCQIMFASVNVVISDGIANEAVKSKMERTMSALLTESNEAQAAKRSLNFSSMGIPVNV